MEAMTKRPRTPLANSPAVDYQNADSEHVLKRPRALGAPDEVGTSLAIFS